MAEPNIVVQYRCKHISCRNPRCYQGSLKLTKSAFDLLHDSEKEPDLMRSPSAYCLLGSPQQFEILSKATADNTQLSIKEQLAIEYKQLKTLEAQENKLRAEYDKSLGLVAKSLDTTRNNIKKLKAQEEKERAV